MGRKRKVVEPNIAVAKEDKASNGCSETTFIPDILHLHTDNLNAMGAMHVGNNVQQNSNGIVPDKNSRAKNAAVRRSQRLKSSVSPSESLGLKPVVEHVNLVENEKEENENKEERHSQQDNTLPVMREENLERETQVQQVNALPVMREENSERETQIRQVYTLPVMREENSERETQIQQVSSVTELSQSSLEEKVNYIVSAVDEFKTVRQVFGRLDEGPSPDFSYKSLYFNSQKKIEALMEEKNELVRKLEFARGKIAAYESMKNVMGASKEVIFVSPMGTATEATVNVSPQAVPNFTQPAAAATSPNAADNPKQKRVYKKRKAKS